MSLKRELYQQMADLTAPKCASSCRIPRSCCSIEYCQMAWAEGKKDGVDYPVFDGPVPHLGPKGCVVAPHHRPLCTLHVCSIAALGFDPDKQFDEAYFDLREKIDQVELDQYEGK